MTEVGKRRAERKGLTEGKSDKTVAEGREKGTKERKREGKWGSSCELGMKCEERRTLSHSVLKKLKCQSIAPRSWRPMREEVTEEVRDEADNRWKDGWRGGGQELSRYRVVTDKRRRWGMRCETGKKEGKNGRKDRWTKGVRKKGLNEGKTEWWRVRGRTTKKEARKGRRKKGNDGTGK